MKLTIISVEEDKSIGDQGAVKRQFMAKGEDGQTLQYFTFSKKLFPSIVVGKEIPATVETTQRGEYTNRKVTAIEGVGGGGGWQGGGRQESPEHKASIETQVAVKAVTELLAADKKVPRDIKDSYDAWLRAKLQAQPVVESPPEATTATTEPSSVEGIDMDWLKQSLETLQWAEVIGWLTEKYELTGNKVSEIIAKMNELQKADFVKEVKNRLQKDAEDLPF